MKLLLALASVACAFAVPAGPGCQRQCDALRHVSPAKAIEHGMIPAHMKPVHTH